MKTFRTIAGLALMTLAFGAFAADNLTGKNGMTLYTFDKDSANKSACAGGCLAAWPAARTGDVSGKDIGEITRDDGSKQATFQGKPLYYFSGDQKAGDKNGDNMQNVWHVAGAASASKPASGGSGYGGY